MITKFVCLVALKENLAGARVEVSCERKEIDGLAELGRVARMFYHYTSSLLDCFCFVTS